VGTPILGLHKPGRREIARNSQKKIERNGDIERGREGDIEGSNQNRKYHETPPKKMITTNNSESTTKDTKSQTYTQEHKHSKLGLS